VMKRNTFIHSLAIATVICYLHSSSASAQLFYIKKPNMEQTASYLVNDEKFGFNSKQNAIKYGEAIVPLIKAKSDTFRKLNNRNSFWISEVLGSIDSDIARETLRDLYSRKEFLPRFVGAIGLHMHGIVPDPINDKSFLVRRIRESPTTSEAEMAILALGYSRSEDALPVLHEHLREPIRTGNPIKTLEAIARIKSPKSIPIIHTCLRDPDFGNVALAFRVGICLGDKEATHLAIERLSDGEVDSEESNKYLLQQLKQVSEKWWLGSSKKAWTTWLKYNGDKWTIPKKFLVDWDKQPFPP
jgi:hypothetical protein